MKILGCILIAIGAVAIARCGYLLNNWDGVSVESAQRGCILIGLSALVVLLGGAAHALAPPISRTLGVAINSNNKPCGFALRHYGGATLGHTLPTPHHFHHFMPDFSHWHAGCI
jgi:hypothetical protein